MRTQAAPRAMMTQRNNGEQVSPHIYGYFLQVLFCHNFAALRGPVGCRIQCHESTVVQCTEIRVACRRRRRVGTPGPGATGSGGVRARCTAVETCDQSRVSPSASRPHARPRRQGPVRRRVREMYGCRSHEDALHVEKRARRGRPEANVTLALLVLHAGLRVGPALRAQPAIPRHAGC